MSKAKTTQTMFGSVKIEKSHRRGICNCGNSSFVKIVRNDEIENHFCKMCARDSWISEVIHE